ANMSAFELKFNKGYWYISTTVGIYVSMDGINWYKEATTPYYLGMITLKMQFVEDDIFLGTFGNGVWKYTHKKVDAGADIYYCKGDSVTLTATAPDLNFTWCCGLGTNKSVTIAPTGIKNYVASATDIFGLTTYDTVAVIEYPLPNLKFSIDDTIQCLSGNKINIVNNSSGAVSYVWKFGDGTTSTTFHPSHSYSFYQDTFEITLIGTTGKGCIDSIKHYVFFNEQPVVSIYAAGDTSVCQGDSVTMYANTGTNISYQWYKNNIAINGANQPFYVAIQSGNYSVEITNNISGCSNKSKSIEITIYQTNYNPNFTASPRNPTWSVAQQQFNLVAFTNLTLNPSNFNFTWLLGDQNTSNQSDPFYNYKFNGLYSVSLIAQHINTGCQDTFTREDYIMCQGGSANPCPITVNITYSGSPLICKNDSFLITATTTGNNLNYIWTHEGTVLTQEDTSFVYAKKSGRYQVIVSDPNCSVTSLPFYLNHYPMLEPIIYGEGNIRPCTNDSMKLFVTTYYKDYYWSTGDSGKFIYTHNSGDYTITVTGVHNCKITSQPFTVNASLLNAPEICIVTVDSATKKNVVAWERPSSNIIIGYNIYKETYQANIYQLIGYRPYDSLSVFVDTNSKPRQWSSRYKITLIDTCNTESPPSPHHKTIHLLANSGTSGENNLIWSHYEGFNFSSYKIYRGTSPSNMVLLDSIPSNLNSYSDLTPPTGLVFYQVSVIAPDTCSPSVFRGQTTSGPFSHSLSNLKDYNPDKKDYLSVSNDTINFDSTGGIILLDVFTTLASWSSVSDKTWLSINDDISNARISLTAQAFSGPGVRNATVTVSGNSVDDFIIKVIQSSVVGIKENIQNNNILIYPNPFNNFFYVYFEETMEVSQIELIDISGKIIQTFKSPKDNLLKINRNEISKGMYFLRITSDKVFVAKIIAN
ncbi:MAG: T9SS type A sorting domain-containing protein, partial [Bacteroidota bacterium]|nr:T9SS type A sorting domain-containing protein [Bacteroidota bacterium]